MDGAIVVDKPSGMTSHDVVNQIRRLFQTKKVGHLGTLDPMATGVLPLLINRATRLAQFFQVASKAYDAEVEFGNSTDTYDREGQPTSDRVEPEFTREELENALDAFRGRFLQTPPAVSAKKVGGIPAYKLARRKLPVILKPVEVETFALEVLEFTGSRTVLRARTSAGTYVRGIAHDLGVMLGCGAFLTALRRTASGDFREQSAFTLDALRQLAAEDRLASALIPMGDLLPDLPRTFIDYAAAANIRQGKQFRVSPFRPNADSRYVRAVTMEGDLVAIGEVRLPHLYQPILVL